jgi:hypothetical protein
LSAVAQRAKAEAKTINLLRGGGALAGAEAKVMQADTLLLECRAFMLG